jgi:sec-independent protein translocase protein TatA
MDIGWPEIAIIAVVILVLFGSKKLPDAARSLGKSMRIMKTEIKGLHDEDDAAPAAAPAQLPAATPAEPAAAPAPVQSVSAGDQTPAP